MFSYLKQVISGADEATCHRFCMVVATIVLGLSTFILAVAAALGADVAIALATVSGPLAAAAGYSYKKAKETEVATS